jgi:hypothetical protein
MFFKAIFEEYPNFRIKNKKNPKNPKKKYPKSGIRPKNPNNPKNPTFHKSSGFLSVTNLAKEAMIAKTKATQPRKAKTKNTPSSFPNFQ